MVEGNWADLVTTCSLLDKLLAYPHREGQGDHLAHHDLGIQVFQSEPHKKCSNNSFFFSPPRHNYSKPYKILPILKLHDLLNYESTTDVRKM